MGDEQEGAVEGFECLLELLDCGQVEMVRRLVEDEEIHASSLEQGKAGSGALAGRERCGRTHDLMDAETELREQGSDLSSRPVGDLACECNDERVLALE